MADRASKKLISGKYPENYREGTVPLDADEHPFPYRLDCESRPTGRAAKHRVVVFTHYAPNIWEWKCDCGQVGSSNVSAASAAALVDAHREARCA